MTQVGRNSRVGRNARIGRSGATVGPTDPLSIVTSVTPFFFYSADIGVTGSPSVSNWADQSGNGRDATGTGTAQPTLISGDADFGGRNSISGDGVDDSLVVGWDPPAPGTTNIWLFAVFRMGSYTAGEYIMAGGNLILAIGETPSTPTLRQLNTTAVNATSGAAVGSSARLESLFSNSTSDYLKAGASSTTGSNAGNSNATGFWLFSRNASGFSDTKIACVGAWSGPGGPTSGEKTALDAWVTAYYAGSVAV